MKRPSDTELISLTEKHDAVTFRWEDGTTADVPRDMVAKSTLLHTTLSDATPGEDVKLTIETGVVQQWLHAVLDEPYQLKMLKAADFLGDDESVQSLSSQAALWLFECEKNENLLERRSQAVANLSGSLVESILKASTLPLKRQLLYLPEHLHPSAIQAAFPSIAENGTLCCHDCFKGCNPHEIKHMWPQLPKILQLTSLSLLDMNMHEDGFEAFLQSLGSITGLRRLDLGNSGLGRNEEHIYTLLCVLEQLSALQELDLSGTFMSRGSVKQLEEGFSIMTQLTHFAMRNVVMPNGGPAMLMSSIERNLKSLRSLDVMGFGVHHNNLFKFIEHLTKMSILRELWMGNNTLGPDGVYELAPDLPKLPSLEVLSLPGVSEQPPAGWRRFKPGPLTEHLASHLVNCTRLRKLDLSLLYNSRNEETAPVMRHLSTLTSLQRLLLAGNGVSDNGVQESMQYFQALSNLQMLSLYTAGSTDLRAKTLLPLVRHLPNLRLIRVNADTLNDDEAAGEQVFGGPSFGWDLPDEESSADDIKRFEMYAEMHPSISDDEEVW